MRRAKNKRERDSSRRLPQSPREKSVFTFRPESQCRLLEKRTNKTFGPPHWWPLHRSQPATRYANAPFSPSILIPLETDVLSLFLQDSLATASSKASRYQYENICIVDCFDSLFLCFLSAADKETEARACSCIE